MLQGVSGKPQQDSCSTCSRGSRTRPSLAENYSPFEKQLLCRTSNDAAPGAMFQELGIVISTKV